MNQKRQKLSIENFSNEIFHEIFDYLDGCEIYQAFLNLNNRFQQLIHSSLVLFKIKSFFEIQDGMFAHHWKEIIKNHRQQIISINFTTHPFIHGFLFSFSIDSSLNHLQSLVLHYVPFDELISVLIHLNSLPQFYSLTINGVTQPVNLAVLYQIIFKISKLKYYKLSSETSNPFFLLPISTTYQQFSSIEYLIIDHHYTFKQLSSILSYTPQLRRLNLMNKNDHYPNIKHISSIKLSNLTHLSIVIADLPLDLFEIFIQKINLELKILTVNVWNNITYLNFYRWEQIILQYLPKLKIFRFNYYDNRTNDNDYLIHSKGMNQFISSFSIKNQWIFDVEITFEYIKYSVGPYKKQWHDDLQEKTIDTVVKSSRVVIDYINADGNYKFLVKDIERVLTIRKNIRHLEIPNENLVISALVRLLNSFTELDTLKIHSLTLQESKFFSLENCSTKISKVYLEKTSNMNEIDVLMTFCPYMTYLKLGYLNEKYILKKILQRINQDSNQHLRLLSFDLPSQDDNMIMNLKKMIDCEKLLSNYTIKRIANDIYLEWK